MNPTRGSEQSGRAQAWGDDNRHDGHELDQDVQRRTGGVLERVTDGVADHGCGVGFVALLRAFDVVLLNGLLRVVLSATGVGHEEGHQHTGHEGAGKEPAEGGSA